MSIGQKLRAAREEKGLTCMEIADATNMLIQMVREIEVDDFHRFAAPVYGKGFIKLFAKAVGLDPTPLIAEFIASQNEAAKAPRSTAPKIAPKPAPLPTPSRTESPPTDTDATEDIAEVPAPPSDSRAKRLKASTVTMPRADSPFAPANQPPPRQPAAPRASAEKGDKKNRENQQLQETSRNIQPFALESDTIISDELPQPVEKSHEPFQYPTRSRPASSGDAPTDQINSKRKPLRPPRPQRRQLVTPAMIAQGVAQLRYVFHALRDRIATVITNDNDEDSRIRNRYALSGVLVCITVLAVIIIAASGSGPEKNTGNEQTSASDATTETEQHEPTEVLPVIPEVETETAPAEPVQIIRVLPAPKMFAR